MQLFLLSVLLILYLPDAVNSVEIKWCVRTLKETSKCEWLKNEVQKKAYAKNEIDSVACVSGYDNFDCLEKMDDGAVDIVNMDAGTAYYASLNFVSVLLSAETYEGNLQRYYSVAVVPKGSKIQSVNQLSGSKLCLSGVGDIATWTLPLSRLVDDGTMPVTTCNDDVKTAAQFFSEMCAPGALNSYNNPFGDNPVSTCSLCGSSGQDWCTFNDKYAGGEGPLLCLKDQRADVAFMRSIDLEYLTRSHYTQNPAYKADDYELLCPQSGRKSIDEYLACNWGEAPANVFVTSGKRSEPVRQMYRRFLKRVSEDFPPVSYPGSPVVPPSGGGSSPNDPNATTTTTTPSPVVTRAPGADDPFTLFNTNSTYGLNPLVSSAARSLVNEDRDGYQYVDGEEYQKKLDLLVSCSVQTVRFCVISEYEMSKCEQLLLALKSKGLRPDLDCILANSTRNCMRKIEEGDADIVALDAGDVYEAGKYYNLVPIANENYGDTGNYYYAVAVSKRTESHLTLFNLIARNSCHGSMGSASGWIYPVLSLIETGQISPTQCDAIKKVGELYRRSCIPGILDSEYNREGTNPVNLCENCAAGGMDKCQRNTHELYYGDSGSFRCLVESGGDIAYTRHMTPRDNTDGRNADHWARNRRSDDYELLCKNGRRASITNWQNCYLAKVPAKAVVTADYRTPEERKIFWNLLNYAQQFYSADSNPYFTLFDSGVDQDDLLFSDSTVRLVEVDPSNQTYEAYLGVPFLKAVNTLNQFDCTSGVGYSTLSLAVILICTFLHIS